MNRKSYLVLGFIILTVLSILAFDFYVLKFGKFWETGKGQEIKQEITTTPTQKPPNQVDTQVNTKDKFLNLLPQIFNQPYLPAGSALILEADKTTQNGFKISWESQEATVGGMLVTSPAHDLSSVYLSLALLKNQTLNSNQAKIILSQVFSLKPLKDFKCSAIKTGTYCESFWEDNQLKRGIGVQGPMKLLNNQTGLGVFFCQFTPTSQLYSWQSCTTEFAKTGVK